MGILSYNHLGSHGRLGNVMFQYAAVLGIAKSTGMIPVANLSHDQNFKKNFKLGSVGDTQIHNLDGVYSEPDFSFQESVFEFDNTLNIDLRGYFQSPKYFDNWKRIICQEFSFSDDIREMAAEKIPSDVCVSVHVRRGDYTKLNDVHHNQTEDWYREALTHFEGYRPVFFSDDIDWVKNTFSDIENAVFVDNEETLNLQANKTSDISGYVDMCAMSFCNAHIIANSSFSWWASYLSGSLTIAPKKWFGKNGPENWENIYCEDWRLL